MPNRTEPQIRLFADGGFGQDRAGAGVAAFNPRGDLLLVVNRSLPLVNNNEAEYAALLLALEAAAQLDVTRLEVLMDSEVVVNQMAGRFAVNSTKLKPWHQQACALALNYALVRYTYIPRERNRLADALANEAAYGRTFYLATA